MIKFKSINKRIGALLLSGVILGTYGCSMKNESNSEESYSNESVREITLSNKENSGYVIVRNIDSDSNMNISGTTLSIVNENGYGIKKWVTTDTDKEIELSSGRYKLLVEEDAKGYTADLDYMWFNISSGNTTSLIINNQKLKEKVSKEDKVDGNEENFQLEEGKTEKNVINFLEDIDNKITEKLEIAKDEVVKDYEIVYDFIFNEGTIKGYTFDELKEITKAKAMGIYLSIDEKLENKFPGYKETIKEKYGNAKTKVKEKLTKLSEKLKDYLKEELGEDEYQSLIDKKDEVIDTAKQQLKDDVSDLKECGGKIKNKVKSFIKKEEE